MQIPQIDNGKIPDEPYNAALGFWLPPDSPYGNFQLKLMKVAERLDEANRRLHDSCTFWAVARQAKGPVPVNTIQRHLYANEEAIYLMRRAADEIIALIWCLHQQETTDSYPQEITVDCIGQVLKQSENDRLAPFRDRGTLFEQLNDIANAFKHSFVNSDLTMIGGSEPSVYALGLHRNKLSSGIQFRSISLAYLVGEFNRFYKESIAWLRRYSETNRP